jgi:ubiquinone/menaquinone biosynthesis C-methylase UbiE
MRQPPPDDPATIWSTWMQPAEILDLTREERFRDEVRGLLWPALGLRQGGVAVDTGSGSGALTRALARWMGPRCLVYGVDRDTNFVAYAAQRANETLLGRRTRYLQGDALALPLPDGIADAVTSYTVISHIPDHRAFLLEQMRVCKPGGRVSVMEVRSASGLSSSPARAVKPTEREQELSRLIKEPEGKSLDDQWQIGKFNIDLAGLPTMLEELGLREVIVDAFCTPQAFDDARTDRVAAERRLDAEERMALDNIALYGPRSEAPLSPAQTAELRRLIRARFAKRRRYLRQGRRLWDYSVGISLVVSGRKAP